MLPMPEQEWADLADHLLNQQEYTITLPPDVVKALAASHFRDVLIVAEQGEEGELALEPEEAVGVLIGPEGGWTDAEKEIFKISGLAHLNLHDFTLRAETACLAAVTVLTAKS